jgi:phage terminase small subunit
VALNAKQQLFVTEFLKDRNATKAAERAGYSPKTARVQGPRLLQNAAVAEAIDKATGKQLEKLEMEGVEILRELAKLAMVDVGEAWDENGQLKPLHEMKPEVRRAIASIEHTALGSEEAPRFVTKVKFWDKPKSLELLGKHFRLWVDKVEVSADATLEQLIKAAAQRGE